jgi:hypothetical protein
MVALRLTDEELEALDNLTDGQLGRATVLKVLVRDFLSKPEAEQREFLVRRLFPEK